MRRQTKQYDRQFKLDVVEHYLSSKKKVRETAEAFDVKLERDILKKTAAIFLSQKK